jgi:uncharacterized protein (DUF1778 family)
MLSRYDFRFASENKALLDTAASPRYVTLSQYSLEVVVRSRYSSVMSTRHQGIVRCSVNLSTRNYR